MAKYDENGFITELEKNEIFVFGSNGQGAHLGGAAATAVQKFGAKMGQAEGLQGQSYAINTMDSEDEMFEQIERFIKFAWDHEDLKFYLTEIGCGIAGYSPTQIAPKFAFYWGRGNIILPDSFKKVIDDKNRIIFRDNIERIMCFEFAAGGAMGPNAGGVIAYYLDGDGNLKEWQSFINDDFATFYKTIQSGKEKRFIPLGSGAGNFVFANKKMKYVGTDIDYKKHTGKSVIFEYEGKQIDIVFSCEGVAKSAIHDLKPGTNLMDYQPKYPPFFKFFIR